MAAAQAGHLDVVEALIQAGARFGHKLSSIVVIICFCQIFCICGKIFGNHIFSLMPFTLPWSQTLILAGTNTERFLDVIFLCSDVILVTLPMIKCCQTCFNFTPPFSMLMGSFLVPRKQCGMGRVLSSSQLRMDILGLPHLPFCF